LSIIGFLTFHIYAIKIKDADEDYEMSLVADEIASMASSAASMDRKAIETRVIELETQLMLTANQQKRTKAANLVRSSMIRFFGRLNHRKTHFDFKHTGLVSYKNYVWRSGDKQAAGMNMVVNPNRSKTPQT
jgi:hypothetical protein